MNDLWTRRPYGLLDEVIEADPTIFAREDPRSDRTTANAVPVSGPAPAEPTAADRSWLNNAGRGALGRLFTIAGGVPQTVGGLLAGVAPETGADVVEFGGEIASRNFGYVPRSTWERVEQARGFFPTIGAALPFILEQGITSAPEIGAALTGPLGIGTAIVGHTGRIASDRARNDGRAALRPGDVLAAAPAAGLNVVADRLLGRAALSPPGTMAGLTTGMGLGPAAARSAAALGVGAIGGGVQEGAEYAATNLGTEAGASWDDALRNVIAGAVAGGGLGGGTRASGDGLTAAARLLLQGRGPVPPPPRNSALPTGGIQRVMPEENVAMGRMAAAHVLDTGSDLQRAMYREDVGEISFLAGTPGDSARDFRGGFGLQHIVAKRSAVDGIDGNDWVRERLPEVLARGRLVQLSGPGIGRRAAVVLGRDRVLLSLMRGERRETWVVTGYEMWSPPGETGGRNPTGPTHLGPRV